MFDAVTGIVASACLIIGMVIGAMMPRYEKREEREAPAPAELGYDPGMRINGGQELRRGDRVIFEGIEFTVIN